MNTVPPSPTPVITRTSTGAFRLEAVQRVPAPLEEVFEFFSRPENLARLTPENLGFTMLTPPPAKMRVGLELTYRVRVLGLPLTWISRITDWNPPHGFSDIQVKGPYREWNHTHRFEPDGDGARITDRVDYRVPGGALVERLLVRKDLYRIFEYRRKAVEQLFPAA